jgi:hypothetical protein
MALTQNDALRTLLADAFAGTFDGGTLEIRTASGAALLATIALPNPAFGSASAGVASKSGTWTATASGSGVARVARFISADTTKVANVSVAESAADMLIDDENIVTGGTVTVTAFTYTCPAS